jgi:hypothetical protein
LSGAGGSAVAGMEADYYIPGHGEFSTRIYLDEQASFIKDWVTSIREAIKNRWTLEEARQHISFLDCYPMGAGMEVFGKERQKMNVARLYSLVVEGKLCYENRHKI